MVNAKESISQEAKQSEDNEIGAVKEELSLKNSKDFNNPTHFQERLKTLESRIKVVRSDFKAQVECLRARMEHLNSNVKTVQGELKINSKKTEIVDKNEGSET